MGKTKEPARKKERKEKNIDNPNKNIKKQKDTKDPNHAKKKSKEHTNKKGSIKPTREMKRVGKQPQNPDKIKTLKPNENSIKELKYRAILRKKIMKKEVTSKVRSKNPKKMKKNINAN